MKKVIYNRNNMASIIELNYDCKAVASVLNYNRKCDDTIWSINMTSSIMIVIF